MSKITAWFGLVLSCLLVLPLAFLAHAAASCRAGAAKVDSTPP